MSVSYILYGLPARANDPIDPAESYTAPDPDGEPVTYMYVWERRADAERWAKKHGGGCHVREVSGMVLTEFGAKYGLMFAYNLDAQGQAEYYAEPRVARNVRF